LPAAAKIDQGYGKKPKAGAKADQGECQVNRGLLVLPKDKKADRDNQEADQHYREGKGVEIIIGDI
jgi:hypothetical protein